MPATITDVSKDGVQVQLDTGMVVKVQVDNLRLVRSKR
jgi:ProP effector